MSYSAQISRVHPGCFLFLIDQSDSMGDPFGGEIEKIKASGVSDAVNKLLQNLVIRCAKSEGIRDYFEVGVIGYGATVGPAFGGPLADKKLVPISEVANNPIRVEERKRKVDDGAGGFIEEAVKFPVWFDPVNNDGTPMCQALNYAYDILKDWVNAHKESYPPIVINISDGEGNDGDPLRASEKIKNLNTLDGDVLLFNCHISSLSSAPVLFPDSAAALPDEFSRILFKMSSLLPESIRQAAKGEGFNVSDQSRGFVFNGDLVALIKFLNIGTTPSNMQLR